jgi:NADPH2:quinone reductase
MPTPARQIVSTLNADATITIEVRDTQLPDPGPSQVMVAIEAAPINPSDIAGLYGPAMLAEADYSPGRIVAPVPAAAMKAQAGRIGQPTVTGIECAGTVIAAGSDPEAQALLGKRVACWPGGGTHASHVNVPLEACIAIPDSASIENASASFVNPVTALGFTGTMARQGYKALVHTASASNLGQMLNRICQEDGIPIVNVVRKPEQVALLKGMGAQYVLDSSEPGFDAALIDAIAETQAWCAFDAIGGGDMAGRILAAMERAATRNAEFSRYGSSQRKHVYVYGRLDLTPTVLPPSIGFSWDISAWLLFPYLQEIGPEASRALSERVIAGIDTTFASHFSQRLSLEQVLEKDAAMVINARRTGEKALILPAA